MRLSATRPRVNEAALGLLEVLVAIVIVAVLVTLSIGGYRHFQLRAQEAVAMQNLRSIYSAGRDFAQDNDGRWHDHESDQFWIQDFWKILYADKGYPGFGSFHHGSRLKGTVFYTPLIESPQVRPTARSFGLNEICLKESFPGLRLATTDYPSQTCYAADSTDISFLDQGQINPRRYANSASVAFLDGHVELVSAANIPPWNTGIFWTGRN